MLCFFYIVLYVKKEFFIIDNIDYYHYLIINDNNWRLNIKLIHSLKNELNEFIKSKRSFKTNKLIK